MEQPDVSVIIVCMNNLKNLMPCLSSITEKTMNTKIEIIVVAYLFSSENLKKLRQKYPAVIIIESNEIRGFAENNNLALKRAVGRYCFIVNDDTEMEMPVIDLLKESFIKVPEAVIFSPELLNTDGTIQWCGRPPYNIFTFFCSTFGIPFKRLEKYSKYINKKGIFMTFNIVGAAFMIKTSIMKELGYFDETYFFCPEDIALSTKANELGYHCYVNSDAKMFHIEGGTSCNMRTVTIPVLKKGSQIFYGRHSAFHRILMSILIVFDSIIRIFISPFMHNSIMREKISLRTINAIFSDKTPKELFIRYYKKIV